MQAVAGLDVAEKHSTGHLCEAIIPSGAAPLKAWAPVPAFDISAAVPVMPKIISGAALCPDRCDDSL